MKTTKRQSFFHNAPEDVIATLRRSGEMDVQVARAAQREIAKALETPLRKGILAGDVLGNIFEPMVLQPGAAPEYPLDILVPGVEKEHRAYAIPAHGRIPERTFSGDYIMVPLFEVGSAIDWPLKLARDARWDIVGRALEIFEAGFVKKANDDGWKVILAAGADRGLRVYDANAGAGRFTLRLLTLMDQSMRRNGGGNSTSLTRSRLTDVYTSIEALEDMRNWTIADVDEVTRREIITSADGYINRLFNINLHEMYELGVGQEYQAFYLDANGINGALESGDVELVVGLDLQRNDSFVNPIREQLQIFEDDNMHRQRRAGVYGWAEHGFACLDNRRVILGSM